jgi:transcriptional regulator with XRE-family HTH domain
VTVDLEDRRTGGTIATQTLSAPSLEDAAEVVAGYVAWSIFKDDPTTPSWCYGAVDGEDIAALLFTREQRVVFSSRGHRHKVRKEQIETLEKCRLQSGVSRYELAQLCDLERDHVKALWLHAKNREQFPRFFRGRYRFAMSLEMVTDLNFSELRSYPRKVKKLRETLCILDRCYPDDGSSAQTIFDRLVTEESVNEDQLYELEHDLKLVLLRAAQKELREIRKQLVLWRVLWASLRHRDERAIWIRYLGLTERQRFHDGARVAELYITVRGCITDREKPFGSNTSGLEQGEKSNTKKALRIVAAVAGQPPDEIKSFLPNNKEKNKLILAYESGLTSIVGLLPFRKPASAARRWNREHASKTRWLPGQRRTPSWQAAYNTACLYGAAFEQHCTNVRGAENKSIAGLAVISLKRAVTPQDSEMQRPSDWIKVDPAFANLKKSPEFTSFLNDQKEMDYPALRARGRPTEDLVLSDDERETLERWAQRPPSAQLTLPCRIVLECAKGQTNRVVAARLQLSRATVGNWRRRFVEQRLDGLHNEPQAGLPLSVRDEDFEGVVVKTLEETPDDATYYSIRSMV